MVASLVAVTEYSDVIFILVSEQTEYNAATDIYFDLFYISNTE